MASNRVWNLMYVIGNTGRIVGDAANPQDRTGALAGAATVACNGWRVWVEHKDTGKRIFEKAAYQREDGIMVGDEVILTRGSRGRGPESGSGFERDIRARYIGGDQHNVRCILLEDDPNATVAPFKAGEAGTWNGYSFIRPIACPN